MEIRDSVPTTEADFTAALPLDISEETASRSDDLLREFAEEAGLDTALIVDRSGALVAGISAEAEVTVEVISALVAGASGAMRALVAQLGESGAMESLHLVPPGSSDSRRSRSRGASRISCATCAPPSRRFLPGRPRPWSSRCGRRCASGPPGAKGFQIRTCFPGFRPRP
jgi:hypothetical protein